MSAAMRRWETCHSSAGSLVLGIYIQPGPVKTQSVQGRGCRRLRPLWLGHLHATLQAGGQRRLGEVMFFN